MIDLSIIFELMEQAGAMNLLAIFARVSAIVFLLPGVSASYVPTQYKLGFAMMLSMTIAPLALTDLAASMPSNAGVAEIILSEAVKGLLIGLAIRMSLFSLQIAGTIIAQSSSIAQIFGGSVSNEAQSTVSNILTISGIAVLMLSGFLDKLAAFFLQSYMWHPANVRPDAGNALNILVQAVSECYALAFQLALPFMALSLFYNMTLGAINRAMPQLLVSFVGAPGIIAASIGLLVISARPMLETWLESAHAIAAISGIQ